MSELLLLRHAEVASHRGDVPVTGAGLEHAERCAKSLGDSGHGPVRLVFGGTRRTRETAEALARGLGDAHRVSGPVDAFALRNPDLYVAGTRVDMVSSPASLADQVLGLSETEAAEHPWFAGFFAARDRIGWWLGHADPPGDDAATVARRIDRFARSLLDAGPTRDQRVVGVTHSPVLRAVLHAATGTDPGEPAYVSGARLTLTTGDVRVEPFHPTS